MRRAVPKAGHQHPYAPVMRRAVPNANGYGPQEAAENWQTRLLRGADALSV
jgi:hypothetical protein